MCVCVCAGVSTFGKMDGGDYSVREEQKFMEWKVMLEARAEQATEQISAGCAVGVDAAWEAVAGTRGFKESWRLLCGGT